MKRETSQEQTPTGLGSFSANDDNISVLGRERLEQGVFKKSGRSALVSFFLAFLMFLDFWVPSYSLVGDVLGVALTEPNFLVSMFKNGDSA